MFTMYEFEVACKNIIIESNKEMYNNNYKIKDISLVWCCKTLGNKKAILIDNGHNNRIYECTYNGDTGEIYLDCYKKEFSRSYQYNPDLSVVGEGGE